MEQNYRHHAGGWGHRQAVKILPPAGATLRDAVTAVNELAAGRSNAVGTVTLTANVTTTTYTGPNVNEAAHVFLFPRTANAATALATTYASISRIAGVNTVTITHANTASTDRTFAIAVLGG